MALTSRISHLVPAQRRHRRRVCRRLAHASAMSALGQKRTLPHVRAMSALPPIADMCSALPYVRFVPKADIRPFETVREKQIGLRNAIIFENESYRS
jgi:hypothetical protein